MINFSDFYDVYSPIRAIQALAQNGLKISVAKVEPHWYTEKFTLVGPANATTERYCDMVGDDAAVAPINNLLFYGHLFVTITPLFLPVAPYAMSVQINTPKTPSPTYNTVNGELLKKDSAGGATYSSLDVMTKDVDDCMLRYLLIQLTNGVGGSQSVDVFVNFVGVKLSM